MGNSVELTNQSENSNSNLDLGITVYELEQKINEDNTINEEQVISNKPEEIIEAELVKLTTKTFCQLFETFLNENIDKIDTINIKISPEFKQYFILLCKNKPEFFNDAEVSLNKIISDNNINSKDIPDIIVLVTKIYGIIKENDKYPKIDPYDLIKSLLHSIFIFYIETNKVSNVELATELIKIIDISIELIKLKGFKPQKNGCLQRLLKFKFK